MDGGSPSIFSPGICEHHHPAAIPASASRPEEQKRQVLWSRLYLRGYTVHENKVQPDEPPRDAAVLRHPAPEPCPGKKRDDDEELKEDKPERCAHVPRQGALRVSVCTFARALLALFVFCVLIFLIFRARADSSPS